MHFFLKYVTDVSFCGNWNIWYILGYSSGKLARLGGSVRVSELVTRVWRLNSFIYGSCIILILFFSIQSYDRIKITDCSSSIWALILSVRSLISIPPAPVAGSDKREINSDSGSPVKLNDNPIFTLFGGNISLNLLRFTSTTTYASSRKFNTLNRKSIHHQQREFLFRPTFNPFNCAFEEVRRGFPSASEALFWESLPKVPVVEFFYVGYLWTSISYAERFSIWFAL